MVIKVLDELSINQIAAGEVIENAASVVKELVENSLDAGATEIELTIKGDQLIRISDNGSGMSKEDAHLAFERHATSKIRSSNDLDTLETMGFRGEALASIASVSKVHLLTNETELLLEGGKLIKSANASHPGTTISVQQLFYNAPVRKRFQKNPTSAIQKIVNQLALANPHVRFKGYIDAAPWDLGHRIETILGTEFRASLKESSIGYFGDPTISRPTRSAQYLIINKRPVQSPEISKMVREAYATRLPSDRHPAFVLNLTLPPDEIDVNVHPQKREIRLRYPEKIYSLIHEALEEAFRPTPTVRKAPSFVCHEPAQITLPPTPVFREEAAFVPPPIQIIGEWEHYLLCDGHHFNEEGITFVNRRRAERRILYERLLKKERTTQLLLVPATVDLAKDEFAALEPHLETLQTLGLQMRPIGKSAYLIESVPSGIDDPQALVTDLASHWMGKEEIDHQLALSASRSSTSKTPAVLLLRELLACKIQDRCPVGKPIISTFTPKEIKC